MDPASPQYDELGTRIRWPFPAVDSISWADVLRRDPCSYCGGPGGTVDHIVALADGGDKGVTINGTGACVRCNGTAHNKANRSLLSFLLYRLTSVDNKSLRNQYFTPRQIVRMKKFAKSRRM